jgi:hypothetical protein
VTIRATVVPGYFLSYRVGAGYYVIDPDKDNKSLIAVDFNFEALEWGITQTTDGDKYWIYRPAPIKHGLRNFDEECQECSQWGAINGTPDKECYGRWAVLSNVDGGGLS